MKQVGIEEFLRLAEKQERKVREAAGEKLDHRSVMKTDEIRKVAERFQREGGRG